MRELATHCDLLPLIFLRLKPNYSVEWPEVQLPPIRMGSIECHDSKVATWTARYDSLFRLIHSSSDELFRTTAGLEVTKTTINME
jgi:hypothetical protein